MKRALQIRFGLRPLGFSTQQPRQVHLRFPIVRVPLKRLLKKSPRHFRVSLTLRQDRNLKKNRQSVAREFNTVRRF